MNFKPHLEYGIDIPLYDLNMCDDDILARLHRQFTIVVGNIGVGKTLYIESLIPYNPDMQYIETNRLTNLPRIIRQRAVKIVSITSTTYEDILKQCEDTNISKRLSRIEYLLTKEPTDGKKPETE